jgi:hypothetical protein
MKISELLDFLENRMKPSHIYQPVLIRALVDAGGTATIRQLAPALLVQDESQILYYECRLRETPIRVLKRHEIVEKDGDLIRPNVDKLSLQEKAEVRKICEKRLQSFTAKRGLGIWDYRLEADPVPDDLRHQVLKESGGRCALCGATSKQAVLHVDHIQPRSRGGTNDKSNLQALCDRCNLGKGNKDATDFCSWHSGPSSG